MLAYIFLMNQCLTRAGGSDKTDCFAGVGRGLVLVIVMLVVLVLVVFVLIMVVKLVVVRQMVVREVLLSM